MPLPAHARRQTADSNLYDPRRHFRPARLSAQSHGPFYRHAYADTDRHDLPEHGVRPFRASPANWRRAVVERIAAECDQPRAHRRARTAKRTRARRLSTVRTRMATEGGRAGRGSRDPAPA